MGKVFTWNEVRTNCVPRPEGFEVIGTMLRHEFVAAPCIIGALIHGSFLRGDHNGRSDIDVLAIYPYQRRAEAVALQQRLQVLAQTRFVPVRIILVDCEMALAGDHTLFPMYHDHLCAAACAGGIVKGDPLQFVAPKAMTYQEEVQGFLTGKMNKFDQATEGLPVMSEERLALTIGKALSFPIHAARKMLQCLAPDLLSENDSKSAVATLYPRLGIPGSVNVFFDLIGLDRLYTEALIEHRTSDVERYATLLERLKPSIELAWQFARLNLCFLRKLPTFPTVVSSH